MAAHKVGAKTVIHLCDGSTTTGFQIAFAQAIFNNEKTRRAGLDGDFRVNLAIYKESDSSFVAEQFISRRVIFLRDESVREAVNSVPRIAEVRRFGDLDSARQWMSRSELMRLEEVRERFNGQFEEPSVGS